METKQTPTSESPGNFGAKIAIRHSFCLSFAASKAVLGTLRRKNDSLDAAAGPDQPTRNRAELSAGWACVYALVTRKSACPAVSRTSAGLAPRSSACEQWA